MAAYFAEVRSGVVRRVIVVSDANAADGANFCNRLLGGTWVETSITAATRGGVYASVGDSYSSGTDTFSRRQSGVTPDP
jgi:hypothetical protein